MEISTGLGPTCPPELDLYVFILFTPMSLVSRELIGFLRLAGYHWQNSVSAHYIYSSVSLHRVWVQKVDLLDFWLLNLLASEDGTIGRPQWNEVNSFLRDIKEKFVSVT